MALQKDFPQFPYTILYPAIRWLPANKALGESDREKLMSPLVPELRRRVEGIPGREIFRRCANSNLQPS
jgi:hypothetical protein